MTKDPNAADAARLAFLLNELRLPAIKLLWPDIAAQADQQGWPAARFLAALAEHELAQRAMRRTERHLLEARLPVGKTLDSFDFNAVPVISKAHIMALASGNAWIETGANLLLFGPAGTGKTHLSAAIGLALVEAGYRKARPLPSADPRRHLLRHQRPSRNLGAFRIDQSQIRTSIHPDYRKSVVRRVESCFSGPSYDTRRRRPPRSSLNHSRNERRKLPAPCGNE